MLTMQAGLKASLKGFQQKMPWMERLDVTAGYELDVPEVNDDLSRELQLYVIFRNSMQIPAHGNGESNTAILQLQPSFGCSQSSSWGVGAPGPPTLPA
jgi:hypothetical protein